jgi:hypothetical protein
VLAFVIFTLAALRPWRSEALTESERTASTFKTFIDVPVYKNVRELFMIILQPQAIAQRSPEPTGTSCGRVVSRETIVTLSSEVSSCHLVPEALRFAQNPATSHDQLRRACELLALGDAGRSSCPSAGPPEHP